ncbi:hypothetical protein Hdeb2414_s0016g00469831 [Helianthus debilis subsp. tardiflorus]
MHHDSAETRRRRHRGLRLVTLRTERHPDHVELAGASRSHRKLTRNSPYHLQLENCSCSFGFSIFNRALLQEISICNHCEYTRSIFPLYTLGCNMYTYSKQLLCLNKTYSIYERNMKLL